MADGNNSSLPPGFVLDEPQGLPEGFVLDDSQPEQVGPETTPLSVAEEFAAAVNRGVINVAEFLTTDQINEIARLSGHEGQLVTPLSQTDFAKQFTEPQITQGMEEGLARDVVRTGGEFVGPGASTGAAFRTIAKAAPMLKPLVASRSADIGLSVASGAGAEIGEPRS